jgi:hypothetical protein
LDFREGLQLGVLGALAVRCGVGLHF